MACGFGRMLALLPLLGASACLDWDSLRVPVDAGVSGDAAFRPDVVAPGPAPIVRWVFAELASGRVPDSAPPPPDLPLYLELDTEDGRDEPEVTDRALVLKGRHLRSRAEDSPALAAAIDDRGGAFSLSLWWKISNVGEGADFFGIEGVLRVQQVGEMVSVFLTTDLDTADLAVAGPDKQPVRLADGRWHHLVATFAPDLALLKVYADGEPAGAASPGFAARVVWPTGEEGSPRVYLGQDDLAELTVAEAAVYTEELRAEEVRKLFAAGRP